METDTESILDASASPEAALSRSLVGIHKADRSGDSFLLRSARLRYGVTLRTPLEACRLPGESPVCLAREMNGCSRRSGIFFWSGTTAPATPYRWLREAGVCLSRMTDMASIKRYTIIFFL